MSLKNTLKILRMSVREKIDNVIRTVPDFPKNGINFKDITSLLMDSELSNKIIDTFIQRLKKKSRCYSWSRK